MRVRREPPPFRRVSVVRTEFISPHLTRVVLSGPELEGFRLVEPAASIRLLLPTDGELVMPTWDGNLFRHSNGDRATIRTFTPRRFDDDSLELHIDVVLHEGGAASAWTKTVEPGEMVAVSGPGRGYRFDSEATAFLLAGDESAIPAICQLLEHLPRVPIAVHLAVRSEDAKVDLHRDVDVTWYVASDGSPSYETLSRALSTVELASGVHVWAAGEAAEMHRIRKHLFDKRDFPRSRATIRGYWRRRDVETDSP